MQERQNFWVQSANILVRFIILGLVVLFLFNIGRSIWKNHDIEQRISDLRSNIDNLENESVNLHNRILYYQTQTYKEIQARSHLFYQKPGENVVILLKQNDNTATQTTSNSKINNNAPASSNSDLPNWQKWINYIFG